MANAIGVGEIFLKQRDPKRPAGRLAAEEVRIDPEREDHSYGRFAWIWDTEGNRVEL